MLSQSEGGLIQRTTVGVYHSSFIKLNKKCFDSGYTGKQLGRSVFQFVCLFVYLYLYNFL